MSFVAKRIHFRNGERHSVLSRPGNLPVHEATLYLAGFRTRGRAANTIHSVCTTLALLYRWLDAADIDLNLRLKQGCFLTLPEISRLAETVQRRNADPSLREGDDFDRPTVIDIKRVRMRRGTVDVATRPVDVATQATRLRYIADYLSFLSTYVSATLPLNNGSALEFECAHALKALRAHIPPVSRRAKIGAREGLSQEDQERLLAIIHPHSPNNPWKHEFVRQRNWLIIILLLATGMRRGELLGLQIGDLNPQRPKLRILRRADAQEDPRLNQPNTKTNDREIELLPAIMRAVWEYITKQRRKIHTARKYPQLIVADDGQPLSAKSIEKIFVQLRQVCPCLPVRLTSHVMRHTWNERFSEQAELMQLSEAVEQKARNEQQGWTDDSKSALVYTRRYASRKGRELSLKLQEKLDVYEA